MLTINKLTEFEPKRILVIFLSGIGNFILFTPTLRAIRDRFPEAEITLCVKQKVVLDIAYNTGLVDNFIHYSNEASAINNFMYQVSLVFEQRKKRYDLVITTFDGQGWKTALFVKMLGGKQGIGYKTFKNGRWYDKLYNKTLILDFDTHEIDWHLTIADCLGAKVEEKKIEFFISQEDKQFAENILKIYALSQENILIGIHPGSGEKIARKRWMPERFAKVADCLSEKYKASIIIFGGHEEVMLSEEIVNFMKVSKPIILTGKTTLRQTAALIKKCNLFISNDSGLMHVAAAVNTPVIAIFGPTDSTKNAPFGEGHIVIKKDIPCIPCHTYFDAEYGCDGADCLRTLTEEDVLAAVEQKLIYSYKANHCKICIMKGGLT